MSTLGCSGTISPASVLLPRDFRPVPSHLAGAKLYDTILNIDSVVMKPLVLLPMVVLAGFPVDLVYLIAMQKSSHTIKVAF